MADSLCMLSEAASRLRLGIPCVLADESPCFGGLHCIFKVVFEDSIQWAARVSDDFQHIKQQCLKIKAPDLLVEEEYPVVYSEWVSGKPLAIWNSQIPLLKCQRLLDNLVEFLLGTARWGNAINYLIMRSIIPDYAVEYDEYSGFGFIYRDLNTYNIIKSNEFHLTEVIDWDWMSVALLPAIIHYP
ncbi:hypothetical protein BDV25DRAFT_129239 [Aspergillus avenaceus]|uniref:Aminoglycoside phosphotransferase domain-containing protein n=1 Tax=Aspergillus avenaceus TaxID=36643 RepID=A0A5N6TXM2_ASPAV|nr:hypothetical protein BDV25DRAFT_129239 [Aspergillus avenaceus]